MKKKKTYYALHDPSTIKGVLEILADSSWETITIHRYENPSPLGTSPVGVAVVKWRNPA